MTTSPSLVSWYATSLLRASLKEECRGEWSFIADAERQNNSESPVRDDRKALFLVMTGSVVPLELNITLSLPITWQ